ncbi:MAG: DHA2 family efflux MFS transporter permease subunit [Bacteroidota bacterium]
MELTPIQRTIIVITTVAAAIMELIDTSIINVALSEISGNLGATIEDTSWVITAYAIANVIIIPLTGFLARYFGRKNYYITSIIIFTIASFMCGQASSLWELVLWRFIQGIGGGALLSTSQGILFDSFPPNKKAMASGLFGMGIVLGPAIGPTLGGYIVDNYSWPLIFYINIPFGILATALAYRFIVKRPEEININKKAIHIDYFGIVCLAVGVGSLQYVLEKGQADDWFDDSIIRILSVTAVLGLLLFIWRQLKAVVPLIDLRVMKSRNLLASNILTFVTGFGLFGSVFIFPVMVQRVLGFTPTEAGMGIVPGALIALPLMPIIGKRMGSGTSPIVFVVLGFIFFILHGVTSAWATPDVSRNWFIIPQLFRGAGTAFLIVPLINQAAVGLRPEQMSSGISLTNMLRQLGGSFGIAVMNTYVATKFAEHKNDLITNITANDPEYLSRASQLTNGLMARGVNPSAAERAAMSFIDGSISKQSFFMAYLDGFVLISIFFVCTIPIILLLSTKKIDAATQAKIAEESH